MLGLSVAAACGTDKDAGDESSMTQGDAANDGPGGSDTVGSDTVGNDSADDEFDAGGETYGGAEWDTGDVPWGSDSTTTAAPTTTTTSTTTNDGDESDSSTTADRDSSTTDTPAETTTDAGGETYGGPDWDTGTSGGV